MRYLLDSHAMLWALGNAEELSADARGVIAENDNRLFISMATLWELSIKVNIGKLEVPEQFFEQLEPAGFEILPLSQQHLAEYRRLPLNDHRDPFDRLLVAQAKVEQLTLISRDEELHQYDLQMLRA